MKNELICKSCNTKNPFYELTCVNCKSYLRERVYNIDLWKLLEDLVASPTKAFTKIIHAEQKNFILFILILVSIKFLINSALLFISIPENVLSSPSILRNYLVILFSVSFILSIFTYKIKLSNKFFGNQTRSKDIFAILSYALMPNIFAIAILFPLEVIFFGGYLFSNNPSPFIIKETEAYIFLILELLIILWTIFLSIIAIYTLTKSKLYSIFVGLVFNLILYGSQYYPAYLLYT